MAVIIVIYNQFRIYSEPGWTPRFISEISQKKHKNGINRCNRRDATKQTILNIRGWIENLGGRGQTCVQFRNWSGTRPNFKSNSRNCYENGNELLKNWNWIGIIKKEGGIKKGIELFNFFKKSQQKCKGVISFIRHWKSVLRNSKSFELSELQWQVTSHLSSEALQTVCSASELRLNPCLTIVLLKCLFLIFILSKM